MSGVGEVPARRPFSWWPPKMSGANGAPRKREIINVEGAYVNGDFADGRGGISVELGARRVRKGGQLGDGLKGAELVVGDHH